MNNLFAFHDPGGEQLILDAGRTGYIVHTTAIGHNPDDQAGADFNTYGGRIENIVRLNCAYGSGGTIPLPGYYMEFARRCANFVKASKGANIWVIANEIALKWDWPDGQPITLDQYVQCFKLCYDAIKSVAPKAIICPQGVAPWNVDLKYPENPSGDWIQQLTDMLNKIGVGNVNGIVLHNYSRGYDPAAIQSEAKMNAPYADHYAGWPTYKEYMDAIPQAFRSLPVFISESNGNEPWQHNQGNWIQAAYADIDSWNQSGQQQIRCLALFRWNHEDPQWDISQHETSIKDFCMTLQQDYRWYENIQVKAATPTTLTTLAVVNMRSEPKLGENKIGTLDLGSKLTSLNQSREADGLSWIYIKAADGATGWIARATADGTPLVG